MKPGVLAPRRHAFAQDDALRAADRDTAEVRRKFLRPILNLGTPSPD
jgi:hypothetical protein